MNEGGGKLQLRLLIKPFRFINKTRITHYRTSLQFLQDERH